MQSNVSFHAVICLLYLRRKNDILNMQINYIEEIHRLRREKNALILAHYYQIPEIQDIADHRGDSLALARYAQQSEADIIVLCGVLFMAETAKILCPDQKVILPDLKAGCSLSDSCPTDDFRAFVEAHPDHTVVSYINTTAEVKALTDIIVTSSNAEHIIKSLPANEKIIFAPDRNLGAYLIKKTGREMLLWDGSCMVHEAFSLEKIQDTLLANPTAKVIAHPESEPHVLNIADFIGSTSALLKYVKKDDADSYIVATEMGIIHQMKKAAPHKTFIDAPVDDNYSCNCSECFYMKMNTMEKLYLCMRDETPEITLPTPLMDKARSSIDRMMSLSVGVS